MQKTKTKIIEVLQGESGSWFWRIKASNGKIEASSETYSSKAKAVKTAKSIVIASFILQIQDQGE